MHVLFIPVSNQQERTLAERTRCSSRESTNIGGCRSKPYQRALDTLSLLTSRVHCNARCHLVVPCVSIAAAACLSTTCPKIAFCKVYSTRAGFIKSFAIYLHGIIPDFEYLLLAVLRYFYTFAFCVFPIFYTCVGDFHSFA